MVPAHDGMVQTEQGAPFKLWVRGTLLAFAAAVIAVFVTAVRIDPYDAYGQPRRMGTHQQLGMAPCRFVTWFGRPCPTCGMTTSFALLAHGDVRASLQANFAGTLLAGMLVVALPWTLWSAASGRWRWVRSPEFWILGGVILFHGVMVGRWMLFVGVPWMFGFG